MDHAGFDAFSPKATESRPLAVLSAPPAETQIWLSRYRHAAIGPFPLSALAVLLPAGSVRAACGRGTPFHPFDNARMQAGDRPPLAPRFVPALLVT